MKLDTPCIGICSTVYGDDICRGCKRLFTEIIEWNHYSDAQKDTVFNRLAMQIVQVMKDKVEVIHITHLTQQLKNLNIRYRDEQDPLCWAYHLLRLAHDKIVSTVQYGIQIKSSFQHFTLRQLFTLIDAQLLELAKLSTPELLPV